MKNFMRKITSRKFLLSLAAFLGSIAATVNGLNTGNEKIAIVGIVCGAISAAIYAAAEAAVDKARIETEPRPSLMDDGVLWYNDEDDLPLDEMYK